MTSPECILFPGQVGLCEPVPVGGGAVGGDSSKAVEETMVKYLIEQHCSEQRYIREAFTLPRYVMHVGSLNYAYLIKEQEVYMGSI